jgi:hypothetical protein
MKSWDVVAIISVIVLIIDSLITRFLALVYPDYIFAYISYLNIISFARTAITFLATTYFFLWVTISILKLNKRRFFGKFK